jgi:hypothetical protein
MKASFAENREPMDGKTCRSICDAVGERLQRDLQPESAGLSPYLRGLLDELERRDRTRSRAAESGGRGWGR